VLSELFYLVSYRWKSSRSNRNTFRRVKIAHMVRQTLKRYS